MSFTNVPPLWDETEPQHRSERATPVVERTHVLSGAAHILQGVEERVLIETGISMSPEAIEHAAKADNIAEQYPEIDQAMDAVYKEQNQLAEEARERLRGI